MEASCHPSVSALFSPSWVLIFQVYLCMVYICAYRNSCGCTCIWKPELYFWYLLHLVFTLSPSLSLNPEHSNSSYQLAELFWEQHKHAEDSKPIQENIQLINHDQIKCKKTQILLKHLHKFQRINLTRWYVEITRQSLWLELHRFVTMNFRKCKS